MSLEDRIDLLTQSINQLTAMIGSKAGEAAMSASADVVKGSPAGDAKPAPKSRSKAKTETKAEPKSDEFDELDELNSDTPTDDDLGLNDDLGLDDDEPAVTRESVKAAFNTLAKKKGGREAVLDIMKKLKVAGFGALKDDQLPAAQKEVDKALEA